MNEVSYPCRCLWRAFLQMTRTTFFRFTMRQASQSRFTDALTFMLDRYCRLRTKNRAGEPPVRLRLCYFCRNVIRPLVRS